MGTIRKRTWTDRRGIAREAWAIDYAAADGSRVRQVIGPGKEGYALARKILAQREAEARLGILNLPSRQTPRFADYAQDWLDRMRPPRVRPSTFESYEDTVAHLLPAFGEKRLGAITRQQIEAWLVEPHLGRPRRGQRKTPSPLSVTSVNYCLNVLKFICRDAADNGHLTESPAAKVKRLSSGRDEGDEAIRHLQPTEIERLLEAAEEPWRTLYLVAVHSGARRGELLALRWRDFDPGTGTLRIRRSLTRFRQDGRYVAQETRLKTRYSRRDVDLSPQAVAALVALPAGDNAEADFIFRSKAGGPIDPDNVDRAWKRHLLLAELPLDLPFHATRHTHASLLIAAGVHPKAIQARLGHASITTTLNIYGHLMPSAFEGVGEKLDQLLLGTNPAQRQNAGISESLKPASDLVDRRGFEPPTS